MNRYLCASLLTLLGLTACGGSKSKAPMEQVAPVPAPVSPSPAPEPAPVPEPTPAPAPEPEPAPVPVPEPTPAGPAPVPAPSPEPASKPTSPPKPVLKQVLRYTNPPAVGFRLEVDPKTNDTPNLVLNLQGPKGVQAYGVAFFLKASDNQVTWAHPDGGTELFRVGRGWDPGGSEPRLARAKALGGTIQVGLFQRDRAAQWLGATPILALALTVKAGAAAGKVELWMPTEKPGVYLDIHKALVPLPVALGGLSIVASS